jgi:CRISPR-associated endonuclease/helicase Cas3
MIGDSFLAAGKELARMNPSNWFDKYFRLLCPGMAPFPWQTRLFEELVEGRCPRQIDLPTGTGKTSFMTVWLLALAWQAQADRVAIPRRLIWVVNRRTVVDQATEEAERLAKVLNALGDIDEIAIALKSLSASGTILAVSTLRGEREDKGEWKGDPSQAAIVVGTVDMIGSRILFSGYGDGAYYRPFHAGLLTVDSLLVNDEAHLTPPFAKLLRSIESRNPGEKIGKKFWFVEMSATHSAEDRGERFPSSLDDDCAASQVFLKRFITAKKLFLELQPDTKKVEARMLELAAAEGAARTILFLEQPEKARDMCSRLLKLFPDRVMLLTGTMRGNERDALTFDAFKVEPPEGRFFLVATSAGEVGIDITSERIITGLATVDHLAQRFGRLDRYGKGGAEAHVLYTPADLKKEPLRATLEYLQELVPEFSSKTLRERPAGPTAREEQVKTAELHEWLIDLWCQTSDPVKSYPKVESWLHGKQEDSAETEVAWRAEVTQLAKPGINEEEQTRTLEVFPVLAREKLREPTYRLKEKLDELAGIHGDTRILVRERDGTVTAAALKTVAARDDLGYTLLLLPLDCGGLEQGMFDAAKNAKPASDVADGKARGDKSRRRYWIRDGEWSPVVVGEDLPNLFKGRIRQRIVLSSEEEESTLELVYVDEKPEAGPAVESLLTDHLANVGAKAELLARKLVPGLATTFAEAGKKHDLGKDRDLWQRCMGRCNGKIVAKSFQAPNPRGMRGYRHELGSVLDAKDAEELVLHLIAAHHGHARPHFETKSADAKYLTRSKAEMEEAPARFARLTEKYGPWGLAYLEAILKAADIWASREDPEDNV